MWSIDPTSISKESFMSAVDHSLHAHKLGDAKHSHAKEISNQNLLQIALVLTLGFSGVEAAAAYFAGSLALISDGGAHGDRCSGIGPGAFSANHC